MMLHSELKSKRWPWLTEGWEVAEDVRADEIDRKWREFANEMLGIYPPIDWGIEHLISRVYRPADRIGYLQNEGGRSTT